MASEESSNSTNRLTDSSCLCGAALKQSSVVFPVDDTIAIRRCNQCGLAFEYPIPFGSSEECPSNFSPDEVHVRPETLQEWVGFARLFLSRVGTKEELQGKKLLDIGCGCGELLVAARENGMQAYGVEINPYRRSPLLEKGFTVVASLEELKGQKFDVITASHVLEHIPDLNGLLQEIQIYMHPQTQIGIAVPNLESFFAKTLKSHWNALGVGLHRWQFNSKTITDVLNRSGYSIKRIKVEALGKYMTSDGNIRYSNALGIVNPLGRLTWRALLILIKVIDKLTFGRFGMALRKFGERRFGDNLIVVAELKTK